jgi:hypothetical protein
MQLSAVSITWQDLNDTSKLGSIIDNKVILTHVIGQEIVGQYNPQELKDIALTAGRLQILTPEITARLSYKDPSKLTFQGTIAMTLKLSNGKQLPLSFPFFMDNVISKSTLDQNIKQWTQNVIKEYIFKEDKNLGVDKAEVEKLLTAFFAKAIGKWQEIINGFKTESTELLDTATKGTAQPTLKTVLDQGKAKLQQLKDQVGKL